MAREVSCSAAARNPMRTAQRLGQLLLAVAAIVLVVPSAGRLKAQDTAYVPATDYPNGRQIVAVYFIVVIVETYSRLVNEPDLSL